MKTKAKDIFKIASIPVVMASLCCLSPVILVLLGVSTVSFAASLSDVLYGQYAWYFRIAGLLALAIALAVYFRRRHGICTLDEAKKRRNEIINTTLTILIAAVIGYIVFLYGLVEYAGILLGIWGM
ncbi:MAG: hypothetical protein HY536_01835 [Candidatus Colwellbacteria bacterium]|nr:hypothetical protein [Candidatus Colwellbacteria bacterium]